MFHNSMLNVKLCDVQNLWRFFGWWCMVVWCGGGGGVVFPCVVVWLPLNQQEAQTSLTIEQRDSEPSSSITQNLLPAEEGKGPVQLGWVSRFSCICIHVLRRKSSIDSLPYLILSYLTLPCLILPYLILSYLTLPYLTLPYLTLPLPYLTLPYLN